MEIINTLKLKVCTSCNEEKVASTEYFSPKSNHSDGLYSHCKECTKEKSRIYRESKFHNSKQRQAKRLAEEGLKKCSYCQEILPINYFRFNGPNTRRSHCGICHRLNHAKHDGREVRVDKTDIIDILNKQEFRCFYSGIELTLAEHQLNSISIDRFDSNLEYTKENIVVTTTEINMMKRNMEASRFIELCKSIAEYNKNI